MAASIEGRRFPGSADEAAPSGRAVNGLPGKQSGNHNTLVLETLLETLWSKMAQARPSLTIGGGFAMVLGPAFNPDIAKKGSEIKEHVFNVREVHHSSGEITITGLCLRAMSVTKDPYSVTLSLNPSDRRVLSARCSCIAGCDGQCKHTAAIVHHVNSERSVGCTDEAQVWMKPSEKMKRLYPKGETIQEMLGQGKPAKRDFTPKQDSLDELSALMAKHNLQNVSLYKSINVDRTQQCPQPPEPVGIHPCLLQMFSTSGLLYQNVSLHL